MELPVRKNEIYTVDILDQGYLGEGITKIDGYTIFVPNAIKGEKCKILTVVSQNKLIKFLHHFWCG